jgi:hypothetical protein
LGRSAIPNFFNLPLFADDGDVHVVTETPRGSHVKFAYDPKLKAFILRKSLLTGLNYPHDWVSRRRLKPTTGIHLTSWWSIAGPAPSVDPRQMALNLEHCTGLASIAVAREGCEKADFG